MGFAAGAALLSTLAWMFVPKPLEVDLTVATRGPLQVTVDEDGKTRIRERYVISAPLPGRSSRIQLHAGDGVAADKTILAVIEPTDPVLLNDRDRAEAEARVRAAEASRERSVAIHEQARQALLLASDEYERVKKLVKSQAISRQEIDAAEHQEAAARAEMKAAESNRRVADFELELAQAALIRSRPRSADDSDIWRLEMRSPIDGMVLRVFQEDASVVTAGMPLIEVGDPADLEVEIDVLSTDAVKIVPGNKVSIEHWGGPAPLEARVRLVEPAGFTKVSALGVEEQRVNVLATFVGPFDERRSLGDAFRVEARIVIWKADDLLKAPVGALFRQNDGWAVFRAKDGRARLSSVTIGQNNGLEAEVLSGLKSGDQIVLHPSDKIRDGMRIRSR
jgi:HlyD family secretion protein